MSEKIEVRIGQVWIDNDPRCQSVRELRVDSIEDRFAVCRELRTDGRVRKIQLKRFRPTQTGYRLKSESTAHAHQGKSESG